MHALSQLSYGPLVSAQCSGELVLVCPIDTALLVVPSRGKPKVDERVTVEAVERKEVAAADLAAKSVVSTTVL
jgi:hypothetical protein